MKKIVSCENDKPSRVLNRLTVEAFRKGYKLRTEKLIAYNTRTNQQEVLFKLTYLPKN